MSENIKELDQAEDIIVQVEEQTQEPKKTGKKDFFIGFFSAIGSVIISFVSFVPFLWFVFFAALILFIVLSIIKKRPFLIIGFVSGCATMVLLAFGLCFGLVMTGDFMH